MKKRIDIRRGAMLVAVAVMLVILLIMVTFSVEIARMQLARTQLRTAADAAAQTAAETLARTESVDQARAAGKAIALENAVFGDGLQLADSDIVFGHAEALAGGSFTFEAGVAPFNSARVTGRRTVDSPGGPLPLFFGRILGTSTFEPVVECTASTTTRDIALVLDRSGSMGSENKIEDLKTAVDVFLDVLESTTADERVSLSSYSTTGTKDIDMTSNLQSIRDEVNSYEADGYTAIGQGLQHGTDSLEFDANSRIYADKVIILMTDGIQNRTPDAETIVPTILNREQTCFTISFGSGANQSLMVYIANETGGTHYHAPDGAALQNVFEEIARTIAVVLID